jgi:hypothetical protein
MRRRISAELSCREYRIPERLLQFIVTEGDSKQCNTSQPGDATLLGVLNIRREKLGYGKCNIYVIPVCFGFAIVLKLWWMEFQTRPLLHTHFSVQSRYYATNRRQANITDVSRQRLCKHVPATTNDAQR